MLAPASSVSASSAFFSSGYCPPEMARVLLKATDNEGKVDTSQLAAYSEASVAYDLWSFGVVLFNICTEGFQLWPTGDGFQSD